MVVGRGPGRGGHGHCCDEAEVRCTHSIAEGPDLSLDGTLGRGVRLVRAVKAYQCTQGPDKSRQQITLATYLEVTAFLLLS